MLVPSNFTDPTYNNGASSDMLLGIDSKLPKIETTGGLGSSKKAINKICQSLKCFLNDTDAIANALQKNPLIGTAFTNEKLPTVVESLFSKEHGIVEMSSDGIANSINTLALLVAKKQLNQAVVTIGLGAAESMPSLRAPSYLMPAIKAIKAIQDAELGVALPRVRVFKATHAGFYANGMNLERTKYITSLTLNFLSEFISAFYPELSDLFIFESDSAYLDTPIYNIIKGLSEEIKTFSGLGEDFEALERMGEKHGGKNGVENALFYAAAHPFYNQAVVCRDNASSAITKFIASNPFPELIIDFGGRPQKTFNSVIEALRRNLHPDKFIFPSLINIIIKPGKVPVYYKAKHGDVLLDSDCNSIYNQNIDPIIKSDYDLLFDGQISEYEYLIFVNQFKRQNKI